ncbi:hypothetical protein HanPSC8_Chr17g0795661 [Helianthus annuus]|nr:hypothetical protein HanPSC8_Chr17g0795661 [Helianthus annuus]
MFLVFVFLKMLDFACLLVVRLSANSNSSMYGHEEEESLEAQTIGNFLPDDDDLLYGVTDCKLQCDDDDVEEELDFLAVSGDGLGRRKNLSNFKNTCCEKY